MQGNVKMVISNRKACNKLSALFLILFGLLLSLCKLKLCEAKLGEKTKVFADGKDITSQNIEQRNVKNTQRNDLERNIAAGKTEKGGNSNYPFLNKLTNHKKENLHNIFKKKKDCIKSLNTTKFNNQFSKDPHYKKTSISHSECNKTHPCKFLMIADLDLNSLDKNKKENELNFKSYAMFGELSQNESGEFKVNIVKEIKINGLYNEKGRGLELSYLVTFNKALLTADDRTGIIYQMIDNRMAENNHFYQPFAINMIKHMNNYLPKNEANRLLNKSNSTKLSKSMNYISAFESLNSSSKYILLYPVGIIADIINEGNEKVVKGAKLEWATVKDNVLYIGSHGTDTIPKVANVTDNRFKYVRKIDKEGRITTLDWSNNYKKIAEALGIKIGYVVHEAVMWGEHLKKWVFLPRKVSKAPYDKFIDPKQGANLIVLADENFENIEKVRIKVKKEDNFRGFSAFKFVPGTKNKIILAIKSLETNILQKTYITLFNINGDVLLEDTEVSSNHKFEGIEFISNTLL